MQPHPIARSSCLAVLARGLLAALSLAACDGSKPPPPPSLTIDDLLKPESCMGCHPNQYAQWAGSMHAYAAEDPVFLAMNKRGQRETGGALGDFCVKCHAPMAVQRGATKDGLDLATVPKELHGITCYFCHSVDSVAADHNNPLHLASDGILRGGIGDPVHNPAHDAMYSALHDRNSKDSATLCGSCHDIQNGLGTKIERTYMEWRGTVYNSGSPAQLQTCGKCHMSGTEGYAAEMPGVPMRLLHDHGNAAVDVALDDFPNKAAQRSAIDAQLLPALSVKLCVGQDEDTAVLDLTLDNVSIGHFFPSGAGQDRRAWVEVVAYQAGKVIFETGMVADDEAVGAKPDPNLWLMRDVMTDTKGNETHMFWDAASYAATGLAAAVTNDPSLPAFFHAVSKKLSFVGKPDRVTVRVRLRPIGLEVLDDLIKSGDLDASYRAKFPVYDLGSSVGEWTSALGLGACVP